METITAIDHFLATNQTFVLLLFNGLALLMAMTFFRMVRRTNYVLDNVAVALKRLDAMARPRDEAVIRTTILPPSQPGGG
jgi:uncharacterized membrane protein